MAKIYVASSWKNENQQKLVAFLREHGHKVYDFTRPQGELKPSAWEVAKINPDECSVAEYSDATADPDTQNRFMEHLAAMSDADTAILLLPCGRSAHAEAGFMAGMGKRVIVFTYDNVVKPELMYLLFEGFANKEKTLLEWLDEPIEGVCRICGCTEDNPCFNPKYGYCYWVDETKTLCSHCADKKIADDPETIHCVNDRSDVFHVHTATPKE